MDKSSNELPNYDNNTDVSKRESSEKTIKNSGLRYTKPTLKWLSILRGNRRELSTLNDTPPLPIALIDSAIAEQPPKLPQPWEIMAGTSSSRYLNASAANNNISTNNDSSSRDYEELDDVGINNLSVSDHSMKTFNTSQKLKMLIRLVCAKNLMICPCLYKYTDMLLVSSQD